MIVQIIFYMLIFIAAASASLLLIVKNVFKGALLLLVCLLAIAGIYVLLFAEFVAVTQILIYAGGIMVVIIFGIMLTSKIAGKPLEAGSTNIFSASLAGLLLFGLLIYLFRNFLPLSSSYFLEKENQMESIGINLMTTHSFPFELSGILLLVSLIGAAVITSFMKTKRS
jgi:NADH:ubiquinone oxidoreductase subunit 6 (subunit J)